MKKAKLTYCLVLCLVFAASNLYAQEFYVRNYWTKTYLFGGQDFGCGETDPTRDVNSWTFILVKGTTNTYQIKHTKSGNYLHIEKGVLDFGKIQSGWHSAQWILEPVKGADQQNVNRIKNKWKPTLYLNNEKLSETNGVDCTTSNPNFQSSWWYLDGDE